MSREILYRGKVKNNDDTTKHEIGEWVYGYYTYCASEYEPDDKVAEIIDLNADRIYTGEYSPLDSYPVIPETVGQYTGCEDIDGKRIFEGDIVLITNLAPNIDRDYTTVVGIVQWCGGAFEVEGAENDDYTPYCWLHETCQAYRKIIGNIHDNPELLKLGLKMKISDYKFKVGDEVITTHGVKGQIIDICDCEACKQRGFYELIWQKDGNIYIDYITKYDADNGFVNYYKIGEYRFNDFDKNFVKNEILRIKNNIAEYEKQLKNIEDEERNQKICR